MTPVARNVADEPQWVGDGRATLVVPLVLDSAVAVGSAQPVTVGLPFPRGVLAGPAPLTLTDARGWRVPIQTTPLSRWADGSVRWLLLDFLAEGLRPGLNSWRLTTAAKDGPSLPGVSVRDEVGTVEIDTGVVAFRVSSGSPLPQVLRGGRPVLTGEPAVVLTDAKGRSCRARVERVTCEVAGPVRATVCVEGTFVGSACRFVARLDAFARTSLLRVRLTAHNPRRAKHPGGLWDLGDPNSISFRDLSLVMTLGDGSARTDWRAEPGGPSGVGESGPVEIYQDSSGGENWNCRTHVNRRGQVPCAFRGYRVRAGGSEQRGLRASPILAVRGLAAAVTAAIPEFWQQFPKAVEVDGGTLRVRLYPEQFSDLHELQGGEQKTHTIWFDFGSPDAGLDELGWVHCPVLARATSAWYAESGVFPHLAPATPDRPTELDRYLVAAIDGDRSVFAGREAIDEYGWRNFGEVYADHEAAFYTGPPAVVSHYNNQYDMVAGAILQFWRTGDRRWWDVADPLARHVADIDIYHTTEDKAAYNGGLFWFTDHYKDAATCTHRTYSRANCPTDGRPYGGGPGSSHNFTVGLTTYYYLTGDPIARAAALSLADWVVAMDDGAQNVLGLIDDGPTGLASCTFDPNYHGPGRGPGLSINALLDGWRLTGRRSYLEKAEKLIRRVVHPDDDIPRLDLLNVELRWSYPVFLVAVDGYLAAKEEVGKVDDAYAYARACLLRYATWMADHERPYLDNPERLEYPTETWAAQEFRKANVLRLAAAHADDPLRGRLLARGRELADRAWRDLLGFGSRHVARAVAIVMTEGTRDDWFRQHGPASAPRPEATGRFGPPKVFASQKQRIRAQLRSPLGFARALVRLARPDLWRRLVSPRTTG